MKKPAVFIFLILIAVFSLSADELLVEYIEGALELREGSGWIELYIGDTIPADSLIRLSGNGFAELSTAAISITLSDDGSYDTESLLRSGKQVANWDIGKVVNSKLSKLISPTETGQTAVMGVRGAEAGEEQLTWVEEGEQYLEEGKQALQDNLFDEAISLFKQGADWALTDEERDEHLFYAALAHSFKGENAPALIILEDMQLVSDAAFFTDYVLLKGKLLIENLAFDDALVLFTEYLEHPDWGETTQVVYFLSAVCHQGLNNIGDARKFLQDAYNIDADSEYGRAAQRMLQSL